jgi:hypothetical protein
MPEPNPFEWVFNTDAHDKTINELLQGTSEGTLVWHAAKSKESKRALCRKVIRPFWTWATNYPGYAGPSSRCPDCQAIVYLTVGEPKLPQRTPGESFIDNPIPATT